MSADVITAAANGPGHANNHATRKWGQSSSVGVVYHVSIVANGHGDLK